MAERIDMKVLRSQETDEHPMRPTEATIAAAKQGLRQLEFYTERRGAPGS